MGDALWDPTGSDRVRSESRVDDMLAAVAGSMSMSMSGMDIPPSERKPLRAMALGEIDFDEYSRRVGLAC